MNIFSLPSMVHFGGKVESAINEPSAFVKDSCLALDGLNNDFGNLSSHSLVYKKIRVFSCDNKPDENISFGLELLLVKIKNNLSNSVVFYDQKRFLDVVRASTVVMDVYLASVFSVKKIKRNKVFESVARDFEKTIEEIKCRIDKLSCENYESASLKQRCFVYCDCYSFQLKQMCQNERFALSNIFEKMIENMNKSHDANSVALAKFAKLKNMHGLCWLGRKEWTGAANEINTKILIKFSNEVVSTINSSAAFVKDSKWYEVSLFLRQLADGISYSLDTVAKNEFFKIYLQMISGGMLLNHLNGKLEIDLSEKTIKQRDCSYISSFVNHGLVYRGCYLLLNVEDSKMTTLADKSAKMIGECLDNMNGLSDLKKK